MASPSDEIFAKFADAGGFDQHPPEARIASQTQRLQRLRALPGVVDVRPLFTRDAKALLQEHQRLFQAGRTDLPDLTTWIRIRAADQGAAAALKAQLANNSQDPIDFSHQPAYVDQESLQSSVGNTIRGLVDGGRVRLRRFRRRIQRAVARITKTEDLSVSQRYILSAPWGIGAVDVPAWPMVGAAADLGVGVVDDYWEREHEDLEGIVIRAEEGIPAGIDDHGTATVGVLLAAPNGHGMVGIVPGAQLVFSYPRTPLPNGGSLYSVADAIDRALPHLNAGDVLLVERQTEGKPVECERDCYDAIRHAVARGIVVIEPAGNLGKNLDAELPGWPDSGAIIVGAGQEGTPQRPASRSWYVYTSYGSRVNVQGYGDGIATLVLKSGYSTGQDGKFNWTSAASAIVAGAAALASAASKLHGGPADPVSLRALMVKTGSPQRAESAAQHIGPRPDVSNLLRALPRAASTSQPAPTLTADELSVLRLAASGLGAPGIVSATGLAQPKVDQLLNGSLAALGAQDLLGAVRTAYQWGLL